MELDVNFVRAQFPAFKAEETKDWAFFENAGGSYVPATVIDRLQQFFVEHKVQPYSFSGLSKKAGEEMDESYAAIAELLNAREDEITIGPSTTLNFYVLAQSLRHLLKVGDEIIVTNQDHEANIGCWRRLSEHGIIIREWRVGKADAELDLNDLEALINEKTKIVCCTLCSNLVATFNDMKSITEMAHRVGALVVADGVSYAPHVIPDVQSWGVDFYAYSTYKTFGTHQGVLWGSSDALKKTEGQGHYFNEEKSRYRLNPSGPQHAQIGALAGITQYFDNLYRHHFGDSDMGIHQKAVKVFDLVEAHEANLANQLLDYLKNRDDIRILGQDHATPGKRASTIAFHARGMPSQHIAQKLAEHQIAAGAGDFYALRCVESLGMDPEDGVVRVSLVQYNTTEEVKKLIGALDSILP